MANDTNGGFTREHVALVRKLRDATEWSAEYANDGEGSAEAGVEASLLNDLAELIEALLPPEGS